MTTHSFDLSPVHPTWRESIEKGLAAMDARYLDSLATSRDWLPGPEKIFTAFSLPKDQVNYVLFGESPYPRAVSANGFAFWDADVRELWSATGLSKKVNRATSLRNIIKMLLIAADYLRPDQTQQENIAALNKEKLIQTNEELFTGLVNRGFLLLNATPVLQPQSPKKDARAWQPFLKVILADLADFRPNTVFLLLGLIANAIQPLLPKKDIKLFCAEHPYNVSFITNKEIINFFKPLQLLLRDNTQGTICHKILKNAKVNS